MHQSCTALTDPAAETSAGQSQMFSQNGQQIVVDPVWGNLMLHAINCQFHSSFAF
jgi:hypothetical protein